MSSTASAMSAQHQSFNSGLLKRHLFHVSVNASLRDAICGIKERKRRRRMNRSVMMVTRCGAEVAWRADRVAAAQDYGSLASRFG